MSIALGTLGAELLICQENNKSHAKEKQATPRLKATEIHYRNGRSHNPARLDFIVEIGEVTTLLGWTSAETRSVHDQKNQRNKTVGAANRMIFTAPGVPECVCQVATDPQIARSI